jgi:hypothetical protein
MMKKLIFGKYLENTKVYYNIRNLLNLFNIRSFATILYELATLKVLFQSSNKDEAIFKILNKKFDITEIIIEEYKLLLDR